MNVFAKGLMASLLTVVPLAHGNAQERVITSEFVGNMLAPELEHATLKRECFNLIKVRRVTDASELVAAYKTTVQELLDLDRRDLSEYRPHSSSIVIAGVTEVPAPKPPEC